MLLNYGNTQHEAASHLLRHNVCKVKISQTFIYLLILKIWDAITISLLMQHL